MRRRLGSRPRSCSRRRPDGPLCSGLGFSALWTCYILTSATSPSRRVPSAGRRSWSTEGLPGRGGAISPGRRFGPRRRRKMHDDLPRTKRTVDELRRPGSGMPALGPVRPLGSRRGCDLVDWRTQRPRRTTRTWPRALPGRITVVLVIASHSWSCCSSTSVSLVIRVAACSVGRDRLAAPIADTPASVEFGGIASDTQYRGEHQSPRSSRPPWALGAPEGSSSNFPGGDPSSWPEPPRSRGGRVALLLAFSTAVSRPVHRIEAVRRPQGGGSPRRDSLNWIPRRSPGPPSHLPGGGSFLRSQPRPMVMRESGR
jgi:hypothetical protein